jgi:AMP nucleosidase
MRSSDTTLEFPEIRHPIEHHSAQSALAHIQELYDKSIHTIRSLFDSINAGQELPYAIEDSTYPFLGIRVSPQQLNFNPLLSFGTVGAAGLHGITLTHPDLFHSYYLEQISLLLQNHGGPVIVGESNVEIPLPFALDFTNKAWGQEITSHLPDFFVLPDLSKIDDSIANGTRKTLSHAVHPLALFEASRVDYSLHRLYHYTGTLPGHFQKFILLTNYQKYIEMFRSYAYQQVTEGTEYAAFIEPGNIITYNPRFACSTPANPNSTEQLIYQPQMPAYHLVRPDGNGLTFINIGVGPSNAKTITDHLAVLRPHCWLMLGHCGGLRRSQTLGDYVLAHAYVREDHVLDDDLPHWIPIPPIAEVQVALQQAAIKVTGLSESDLKSRLRTGTVFTTDNRNWEMRSDYVFPLFNQSRAIAMDMESATIAANGFRFRVPYGSLLCISDKPVHGEIKTRSSANHFYQQRMEQHLLIGIETMRALANEGGTRLHSRKLRGFDDPPFR